MKEKKLLNLLLKKKGFFEVIVELSEKEATLDLSHSLSVLEQKKILLSCIDEIDAEIDGYKDTFHNLSQEIHDELQNIKHVIERILHLDQRNREKRKKENPYFRKIDEENSLS